MITFHTAGGIYTELCSTFDLIAYWATMVVIMIVNERSWVLSLPQIFDGAYLGIHSVFIPALREDTCAVQQNGSA